MAERGMETAPVQPHQSVARDSKDTQRIEYFKQRLSIAEEKGNKAEIFQAYHNLATSYYDLGDYKQAIEYDKLCLGVAKKLKERELEGQAYEHLGFSYNRLGNHKQAIEYHKLCLIIASQVGDRKLEGHGYRNVGISYYGLGDHEHAIEYYKKCLSIAKETGDRDLEGQAYEHLGLFYRELGDYKQAIEYHKLSIKIAKEVEDRKMEGHAYRNIGISYYRLGDHKQAIEYHKLSIKIAKEVGDRKLEGQAYGSLGVFYKGLGDHEQAIEYHKLCLIIAKEVGDREQQEKMYRYLAASFDSLGDHKQAIEYHKQCLSIAEEVGDRKLEGQVYVILGDSYMRLGDYKQAIEYHKLCLSIAKEIGDRKLEGLACEILGALYNELGDHEQAIEYHKLCLIIAKEEGDRKQQKEMYRYLAASFDSFGDHKQAIEHYKKCLSIAEEVGDRKLEGQAYQNLGVFDNELEDHKKDIELHKQYLSLAKEVGDRKLEGQAYENLGVFYNELGDHKQAIEYHKLCLKIANEEGDREQQEEMYRNLAVSFDSLGDHKQAIEYYEQCLSIAEELGDRKLKGKGYKKLGVFDNELEDHKQAIEHHKQCLSIAKEIVDRKLEGQAYKELGVCSIRLGDYKQAIEYHEQCLIIAKEIADRKLEGKAYKHLGSSCYALGDYKQAIEYHKQCLSIAKEVGNRKQQQEIYRYLGLSFDSLRDHKQAIEYHEQCLIIAKEIADRKLEGKAYKHLGSSCYALGDYEQAIKCYKQCLSVAKEIGDRKLEGQAYGELGSSYDRLGDYDWQTIEYHKQCLSIAKEVKDKKLEAEAYERLGSSYIRIGDDKQAIECHKLLLSIAREIGDGKLKKQAMVLKIGLLVQHSVDYLKAHAKRVTFTDPPDEINVRGPRAKLAYENALRIGKVKVYRSRIMFIGQDRAGKTSLKKSLLGMPFDPEEQSTVGIEVDPSSFEVDVEQVKDWQRTDDKLGVSQFAQELARMAAGELKKDANVDFLSFQDWEFEMDDFYEDEDKTSHNDSALCASFTIDKVEKTTDKNDRDDHHNVGKSGNGTEIPQLRIDHDVLPEAVPELKIDPALPLEAVSELKIDPALPLEEFAQYLIEHLAGVNLHTDSTSTEPVVDVDLWDFAGQHLYYASHPVFLSRRAIYLLVCNLSKALNDTAQPYVKQGILDVRLENLNGETNLDNLLSWLVSVSGICSTKQEMVEKELPYLRPPVFIVGTHADKPFQDVNEIKLQIQKEICGKGYGSHVIPVIISIDNTRSSSDAGVNELRKEIMKVLKQEPYVGEEVPVRWFNFQKVVEALVSEKIFFLNLKQLQTIAQKACFIESEDEIDVMLDFYHDLGMIIKHRSTVVLKAQWLIDVFKQLITIPRYEDMNSKDRNDWECLERKGILHSRLVDRVFFKFIQQGLVKEDILDMMEQFGLIAKFATSTDVKYFVPSQLKCPPKNLREMEPSPSDPCPLYLDFLNGFVPHGIFYQLVSHCIRWCSENGFKRPPTLFCNGARFFIEKHFFYHLILFCKKRFIKIVLKQIKPARETPLAKEEEVVHEVPILVRRLLVQYLQELSRDLPWLKNVEYEFRVACPYCPEEEKSCHKHDQISCAHDDCLCLLEMVPPEQLMCEESFSDEIRMVPGLEKWFSSEDEKDRTQISTQDDFEHPGTLKTGQPSHDDLQHLSNEIYGSWKVLGRQLQLTDSQLLSIDLEELAIYEKCYRMLRKWIQVQGASANYGTLAQALENKLVDRRDLAFRYCHVRDDAAQVCQLGGGRKKLATVFDSPNSLRPGKPSGEDLQHLASEIYDCWKVLGRQLKLIEAQLFGIDREEENMYEKCYRMLRKWTETYSSDADFETLARALEHNLVKRKDLAFKYCYTCQDFSQFCYDVPKSTQVFEDLRQMRHDVDQVSKGTDLSLDLKMAALDKGFRIADNQGSGNCLFYALSEQLKLVKRIEIPHEELRSKLVQYLKENPKMLDGTDLFHFVNGYQSWADYLTNMEQDGTWGDHVILYAAANCYETCIHVISSLSHLNDVIIRPSRHVDDRNPLMLGHIHEIHYVSLQPIQGHSGKRYQDETSVCQEVEECAKRLKTD